MKRVVLYSMSACPHCQTAKRYLDEQRITYRLVNVRSPAGQKEFAKTGLRGVPALKIGDQFLAGFNIKQFKHLYES